MPQSDSLAHDDHPKNGDAFRQLGLQPGASMRDIEAAYWRFARDLRGQPAMAPYTQAYEDLVNSVAPRANDTLPPDAAQPAPPENDAPPARPLSKLGWPDS